MTMPRSKALKLKLIAAMAAEIKRSGLTQAAVAAKCGVSGPRISNIVNGEDHLFSIGSLTDLLHKMGVNVNVTLERMP